MSRDGTLLCLSHLPWDGVWQRPQQLMSRLARRWPVTYVCEPEIAAVARPELVPVPAPPGVSAWQPVFPDDRRSSRAGATPTPSWSSRWRRSPSR